MKLSAKKELPKIEDFLNLKSFALVGASAAKKKFGNYILKAMVERGFKVYPIHRTASVVSGVKCYNSFDELPEMPEGVIICVPPKQSEIVIKQAAVAGVKNIWIQLGADSHAALTYCHANDLNVISGECMMMFFRKPGFPHNLHRFVWGIGAH
jgi:uncharacterized protein